MPSDHRAAPTGRLAVYPGSFDPIHNGHADIIARGARIFDRIVVAVLRNIDKAPLFSADARVALIRETFRDLPNVEVDTFDGGLLVDYARAKGATAVVRGLRAVSDFEYEFQMALMNRHLDPQLETVFMMPAEQNTYISSRLIREVSLLGGSVHGLVPPHVEEPLRHTSQARRAAAPVPGKS
jgi:pantetheine-phosphate adenylyltransferase